MSARLPVRYVEKVWGMDVLPAPFIGPPGKRIGEIWFEPPEALPDLLVKYIFTSEPLSVQVHPSDTQTVARGIGRQGKEECWLVIAAEPGARLGIGFERAISENEMRSAAVDGSIENLLSWHQVKAGDFFYIPANTVHAIGAGISLIEVQQNSDITYRLFDYDRPRELQLDSGISVAKGAPYDLRHYCKRASASGSRLLVDGPLFRIDLVEGLPSSECYSRYPGVHLLIPQTGSVKVGSETIPMGNCGIISCIEDVIFRNNDTYLLIGNYS